MTQGSGSLNSMEQSVFHYLCSHPREIDAESLWLELKREGIMLSIGSVYLKLKKLEAEGLVVKVHDGGRKFLYKSNTVTDFHKKSGPGTSSC